MSGEPPNVNRRAAVRQGLGLAAGVAAGSLMSGRHVTAQGAHGPEERHTDFVILRDGGDAVGVDSHGNVLERSANHRDVFTTIGDAVRPRGRSHVTILPGDYVIRNRGVDWVLDHGNLMVEGLGFPRLIVDDAGAKHLLRITGAQQEDPRPRNVSVRGLALHDTDPVAHATFEQSHGLVLRWLDDALAENCFVTDIGDEGVEFSSVRRGTIRNIRGYNTPTVDPGGGVINISGCTQVFGVDSFSVSPKVGPGFRVRSANAFEVPQRGVGYVGCTVLLPEAIAGISVIATLGDTMQDIQLIRNHVILPAENGIHLQTFHGTTMQRGVITHNRIDGGGTANSNGSERAGIHLVSSTIERMIIAHNHVADYGLTNGTHLYSGIAARGVGHVFEGNVVNGVERAGLLLRGSDHVVRDNVFLNFGTVGVREVDPALVLRGNVGHPTENHGVLEATGDGRTTRFRVDHGLVTQPTVVNATSRTLGSRIPFRVILGEGSFVIDFEEPPAAGDRIEMMWEAKV